MLTDYNVTKVSATKTQITARNLKKQNLLQANKKTIGLEVTELKKIFNNSDRKQKGLKRLYF